MKKWTKRFTIIAWILGSFLSMAETIEKQETDYTSVLEKISSDPLVFAKFHRAMVLTFIKEDRAFSNTKDYAIKNTSQTSFTKKTLDFMTAFFIAEAMANELSGDVCFFGGWPSVKIDGSCRAPWSEEVRTNQAMTSFTQKYQTGSNCEEKSNENFEYRTCNPVLFGPGGTRKMPIEEGICISIRKINGQPDYSNFTESCFQNANLNFRNKDSLNNLQALYSRVQNDESFREEYKRHAEAVVEFCQENPSENGNTCEALLAITSPALNMMCMSIGDNVTRGQLDRISTLWNSMRGELVDLDWVSAERMDESIAGMTSVVTNRSPASSYGDIDWEGEIPETAEGMEAVAEWAKRLASRSCSGQSVSSCNGSKDPETPTGYCWRHVKLALEAGGAVDGYIPSVNAFDAHNHGLLEQRGFCNVGTSASEAPINSILVYERTDRRSGNPGHIEIKTGANEYVSDFISDRPIDAYNSERRLAGVYIPCEDQ